MYLEINIILLYSLCMMLLARLFFATVYGISSHIVGIAPIFHVAPLTFCGCDAMFNFAENKMMLIYE